MSDGKQFKKPWDIWQHGKLQIYGEAWKENKQRPSMKISMWNNNPRFIIYMNNDSPTAKKSISFALDTYIAGDLTELMKDCIRKKDPSRVGVELKAKRDHRGGTYEKPTVVAKIFLGRDTDGVMYIAFQAKGEALAKFPMLPSFWAELVGENGEPMDKPYASELRARTWCKTLDGLIQVATIVNAKDQSTHKGGDNKGGSWNKSKSSDDDSGHGSEFGGAAEDIDF